MWSSTVNFQAGAVIYGTTLRIYDQWRSQPDSLVPLCKFQVIFKLLSLFISLEIDLFLQSMNRKIFE